MCHSDLQGYEIEPVLRRLNNTAPGYDNLPAWLFSKCSVEISDIVAKLLSLSFTAGKVYTNWKLAVVTPVPKISKPITYSDFRPISVTPILSRVAERLIVRKCIFPAIPSDVIQDQFAFRPTGSTTCTLVYLLHHVCEMLETNNYVRRLSVDFSKAFDIVSHELLLRKIAHMDLQDNVYNWIVSFLIDRQQKCAINGSCSPFRHITRGIVQGSGVGPTFYIIYKNDLKVLSASNKLSKYADDINLLVPEHTDVCLLTSL